MKMTRKLIPALVMLLVSAIMLSTASYAWFATSREVSATGMNVKVKSDAKFLQIATTDSDDPADFKSSVPAADDGTAYNPFDLIHADIADDKTTVSWYYSESKSSTEATTAGAIKTPVTDNAVLKTNYALVNDFWVKMSEGSTTDLKNLEISKVVLTDNTADGTHSLLNAVRVLVVGPNGSQIFTNRTGTMELDTDENCAEYLIETVTKDAAQKITVYVYFDGEDPSATTDNAKEIADSITVSVFFTAVDPT